MSKFRATQTENERLARAITGPDTEATFHVVDEKNVDNVLRAERTAKFNDQVGELEKKFQTHIDTLQETGKQITADLQNLEIMPLTSYVLISPFKTNPFQKIKEKNGLITDLGTECKFLKPGDIVFYNIASEVQVPFFKFGFVIVAEQRIIAVVNEKLTERKTDIVNTKDK